MKDPAPSTSANTYKQPSTPTGNPVTRNGSLLISARQQQFDFDVGFVIDAFDTKTKAAEKVLTVTGEVGSFVEVFRLDLGPDGGNFALNVRFHLEVVDANAPVFVELKTLLLLN